jgi:hypothetical protein
LLLLSCSYIERLLRPNTMMNHRKMLRDALLAIPLVVAVAFGVEGVWGAFGALLAGLFTTFNLWVIMMLTFRFTDGLVNEGRNLGMVGVLSLLKVPLALIVYTVIANYFGLMATFLGLMVLMSPILVRGSLFLLETPIPADEPEMGSR